MDGLHHHRSLFFPFLPRESLSEEAWGTDRGEQWGTILVVVGYSSLLFLPGTPLLGGETRQAGAQGQESVKQAVANRPREGLADTHPSIFAKE